MTTFASGTPDFNAYSCTAAAGPFSGSTTTVYYRAEGGSVVGVLPLINNVAIKQLDLSPAGGCPQATTGSVTCVVGGTSATNGKTDSWTSGVFTPGIAAQIGISDLEPKVFVGDNFPTDYNFIGPKRSAADLKSATLLPQNIVFQQTFGLILNNNTAGIAGVNNLSRQAIRDILTGGFANWNAVPAAPVTTSDGTALVSKVGAGPGVANASVAIKLCNREEGSGTRTGTALYFLGDECTSTASAISDPGPDNFSTTDEIACVQGTAGAIGYVSIDKQAGLPAGVVAVAIDGVLPTNTKSALGLYDWVYEASMQRNPAADANDKAFYNYYVPRLQALASAPQSAQVNVVPFIGTSGNTPGLPLSSSGIINVSNYTRNGDSCTALAEQY
jgi:ABC-type phosphate transport system substrate-binding protein